jgi:hypothetical protein
MAASLKGKRTPITTPPYQVPSVDITPDPPIFSLVTTFKYCIAVWQKQLISMAIFKNLLQNVPIDYNHSTRRFLIPKRNHSPRMFMLLQSSKFSKYTNGKTGETENFQFVYCKACALLDLVGKPMDPFCVTQALPSTPVTK